MRLMRMRLTNIALVIAGGLTLASPALAGIHVRAPGVGIGVDIGPHRDRDHIYPRRVYRDDGYAGARCRGVIVKSEGVTRKIRRCRY